MVPPEVARAQIVEALDALDAAYARIRETSTDLVGQTFRVQLAERLETASRVNLGLSYRVFGELADPPDGPGDSAVPVRDVLAARLRITVAEVRARMRVAARIRPRRSLTGPPTSPELPALAAAVEAGQVGEGHVREVCKALHLLPVAVGTADRERAEEVLVGHACEQDAAFVAALGKVLGEVLNPDGHFEERDREIRRELKLGAQGPDGMSKLTGWLNPEARAYLEAVGAAVRPGHHVPGADQAVVDAAADTRTPSQRLHDALAWGLRTALASGGLGTHRGIPVTVIARTTVGDLEQAAKAIADPSELMPAPARTGGGSAVPMRDLIRMAAEGSMHYLAVFENHSARPLYLARARLASVDQRIICHARDVGCTRPGCTEPGYHCEVHHATGRAAGGLTEPENLFFACGPDNRAEADGAYRTTVDSAGRLAWTDGISPPATNPLHHPEELLKGSGFERGDRQCDDSQHGDVPDGGFQDGGDP